MKKLIYIFSVLVLSVLSANTSFAYNYYTDNGATYSNEQFQRDVKSYLDTQVERQQNQDLINNINQAYSGVKTQFEIDQMQKKLDEAKKNYDDTSAQIKQVQDLIYQQNLIIAEQKKLKEAEQKEYEYKNAVCKEVDAKYNGVVEIQSLADNCAKYDVYLKVEKPKTETVVEKTTVKKAPRPAFLDEQNDVPMPDILKDVATQTVSTTTMHNETIVQKSFIRKTFEKIKSFFAWW